MLIVGVTVVVSGRLGVRAVAGCVLTIMSAGLGPCATTPHAATDKRETTTDKMLSQT